MPYRIVEFLLGAFPEYCKAGMSAELILPGVIPLVLSIQPGTFTVDQSSLAFCPVDCSQDNPALQLKIKNKK
jgi:hypothetical protein